MSQTILSWAEKRTAIQARQNERAGVSGVGTDIPYIDPADIDICMREAANLLLAEAPTEELEAIGSAALSSASAASGATITLPTIRIIGVRIDGNPAVQVQPAAFYQNRYSAYDPSSYQPAIYMFGNGKIYFNGTLATIVYLSEPSLAQYQADAQILPPKYDSEIIELTHQLLEASDALTPGRL